MESKQIKKITTNIEKSIFIMFGKKQKTGSKSVEKPKNKKAWDAGMKLV